MQILHFDKAAFAKRGLEQRVVGGELAGMRARRAPSGAAVADLEQNNRLAEFERALSEFAQLDAFGARFEIRGDHFHIVLTEQRVAEIKKIQIGFIAARNEITRIDTARMRVRHHGEAHAAALRHHGHRAGFEAFVVERAAKGAERVRIDVGNADTIGADHAHTTFFYRGIEFALHRRAGFADFRKAAGEHHGERNACFAAIAQRLRHLRG